MSELDTTLALWAVIIGAISTSIASVSVAYAARQLRASQKSGKTSTHQTTYDSLLALDRIFVDYPQLAKLWGENNPHYQGKDREDTRKKWAMLMVIDWYKNLWFQAENENAPREFYIEWQSVIKGELAQSHEFIEYWKSLRDTYPNKDPFVNHVNKLLNLK